MQRKLLEIISVDIDETGQLLTVYSAFINAEKKWNTTKLCISSL
jgi:hypothetical protein